MRRSKVWGLTAVQCAPANWVSIGLSPTFHFLGCRTDQLAFALLIFSAVAALNLSAHKSQYRLTLELNCQSEDAGTLIGCYLRAGIKGLRSGNKMRALKIPEVLGQPNCLTLPDCFSAPKGARLRS